MSYESEYSKKEKNINFAPLKTYNHLIHRHWYMDMLDDCMGTFSYYIANIYNSLRSKNEELLVNTMKVGEKNWEFEGASGGFLMEWNSDNYMPLE